MRAGLGVAALLAGLGVGDVPTLTRDGAQRSGKIVPTAKKRSLSDANYCTGCGQRISQNRKQCLACKTAEIANVEG